MLAFQPQIEVAYGVRLTILSLVMAIALTGMGFLTAMSQPNWKVRATGGALVGLGIAGMHYTGMSALRSARLLELGSGLGRCLLAVWSGIWRRGDDIRVQAVQSKR